MNRCVVGTTLLGLAIAALPQVDFAQSIAQVVQPPVNGLDSFIDGARALFARFHLIPIIVPRGERVGNSYNRESTTLQARTTVSLISR
jgi:hypothetical protein